MYQPWWEHEWSHTMVALSQTPDIVSKMKGTGWRDGSVGKCSPCRHEDLGLDSSTNLRAGSGEAEAGRFLELTGQPVWFSERPCLKNKREWLKKTLMSTSGLHVHRYTYAPPPTHTHMHVHTHMGKGTKYTYCIVIEESTPVYSFSQQMKEHPMSLWYKFRARFLFHI